jgi:hypothetical protein
MGRPHPAPSPHSQPADARSCFARFECRAGIEPLLERGSHGATTDLVIAPIARHRRNIKQRFAAAGQPRSSIALHDPVTVGEQLVDASDITRPARLDRIDRLGLLETCLEDVPPPLERLIATPPSATPADVETVWRTTTAMTNYHPARIDAFCEWFDGRSSPAAADARDLLAGGLAVEQRLAAATDHLTSDAALLRLACRRLRAGGADIWRAAVGSVDRVWVCGLSGLPAPLADLLGAVLRATAVSVTVVLRPVAAAELGERLAALVGVPEPGREAV